MITGVKKIKEIPWKKIGRKDVTYLEVSAVFSGGHFTRFSQGPFFIDSAHLFRPGLEFNDTVFLAEFPLTELKEFQVSDCGVAMAAGDASVIELHLDLRLCGLGQKPAIRHLHVLLAIGTKDSFGIFNRLHGTAPENLGRLRWVKGVKKRRVVRQLPDRYHPPKRLKIQVL